MREFASGFAGDRFWCLVKIRVNYSTEPSFMEPEAEPGSKKSRLLFRCRTTSGRTHCTRITQVFLCALSNLTLTPALTTALPSLFGADAGIVEVQIPHGPTAPCIYLDLDCP